MEMTTSTHLKKLFTSIFFKFTIKGIKKIIFRILCLLPDYLYNYLFFVIYQKYLPRFKKPRSLSEKIINIKLYDKNPLRALVADRIKVRKYVANKTSELKYSKIHWAGPKLKKEIWDILPNKFVIKSTHGSGMAKIVDKKRNTFHEIIKITDKWLATNYAAIGREWYYEKIKKMLIIEEFLTSEDTPPPDYKFICFNGKVEMVQLDIGRFNQGHARNFYDCNFNKLDIKDSFPDVGKIKKHHLFNKAISIAESLASDFDYIRVDLYLLNDGVYFGELTNTSGCGFAKYDTREMDFLLGSKLKLTSRKQSF